MTDIVERLRFYKGWKWPADVMFEAADEIERLEHMQANLHGHIKRLEDENSRLHAENAKLREALRVVAADLGSSLYGIAALQKDEGHD